MLDELDITTLADVKASLLRERRRAVGELEEAERALDCAGKDAAPFEAAFWEAHWALAGAVRGEGELRPLYDARMNCGVAAHPYRERVRGARLWRDAVVAELRATDARIEATAKAMNRPAKGARTPLALPPAGQRRLL
jgi:hypothetical protein